MPHPLVRRRSLPLLARTLVVAATALAAAACSGSTQQSSASASTEEPRPRPNRSMLTREEMAGGHWASAYEMIESLRPRWLSSRGAELADGSAVEVQVYLDNQRLGGINALRTIQVADIAAIQFVDPVAAASRWGPDHHNGAIMLSTRTGGR
jgi:hypothetical protein